MMKPVDLETAKTLMELGYNGDYQTTHYLDKNLKEKVPVPRLDDVAYWIREKYRILIFVRCEEKQDSGTFFDVYFTDMSNDHTRCLSSFSDYDYALECGVKMAIEIIKNRQNNDTSTTNIRCRPNVRHHH